MGVQLKTLSAAFLKFLPLIGVALVVAGAVGLAINKIFFTPEIKAYNKQVGKIKRNTRFSCRKSRRISKSYKWNFSTCSCTTKRI